MGRLESVGAMAALRLQSSLGAVSGSLRWRCPGFAAGFVERRSDFHGTAWVAAGKKPLPPRPKIAEEDIEEAFLKGSGPGGQKINKTNSAVQLKHLQTGLVIKVQETRSRSQNRKIARRILAERLEEIELGDQSRTAIKREAERKKKHSRAKKARRKYGKLEEEKKAAASGQDEDLTAGPAVGSAVSSAGVAAAALHAWQSRAGNASSNGPGGNAQAVDDDDEENEDDEDSEDDEESEDDKEAMKAKI